MNVMKSAVTIILLICIIHSVGYIYKLATSANIEHFERDHLDLKLEKSLQTTFEKILSNE